MEVAFRYGQPMYDTWLKSKDQWDQVFRLDDCTVRIAYRFANLTKTYSLEHKTWNPKLGTQNLEPGTWTLAQVPNLKIRLELV